MRISGKKIVLGLLATSVVYIASYAILSTRGGYVFTQSGKIRIGISLDDEWIWMPRYGWAQSYQWPDGRNTVRVSGLSGWLYLPLILADQSWVHPTQRFITPEGKWVKGFIPPSTNSWHHDMLVEAASAKAGRQSAAPRSSAGTAGAAQRED